MAKTFYNNLNLSKFELQNAVIQNLAGAPSSPVGGQIYYNTGDGNMYVYDGIASGWVDLTTQGTTSPDATTGVKGLVQLAGDLGGSGTAAAAPIISAGAITATKIADALKPSVSAAAGTEALRALGTSASTALAGNTTLNSITAPTASLSLNSQKITNLADGTTTTDAATWGQVQSLVQGLDTKGSVIVAYTTNHALTGAASAEGGVTPANGDRVLLTGQTAPAENGIWVVNTGGAWTRATDADSWIELIGAYAFVERGSNADNGYVSTVDAGGTLGTTAVTWTQFSGAGQITAGGGIGKSGNTLTVAAGTNLTQDADGLSLSATYAGQNTIVTLGTITTGTWNGTDIGVADGGTGAGTAAGARTNLQAAGYYSTATHSSGTTITITQATHLLRASRGIIVQVQDESTGDVIETDYSVATSGDVTVTFGASQTANSKRVTLVG